MSRVPVQEWGGSGVLVHPSPTASQPQRHAKRGHVSPVPNPHLSHGRRSIRGSLAGIHVLSPSCKSMPCPTGAQIILHPKQLATEARFFTPRFAAELQGVTQPRQTPWRAQQQLEEGTLLVCKAHRETRTWEE